MADAWPPETRPARISDIEERGSRLTECPDQSRSVQMAVAGLTGGFADQEARVGKLHR